VILGTRSPDKAQEIRELLVGLPLNLQTLPPGAPDVAETAATFRGNAELKALALARVLNAWVLGDDSGLEVDALDGAPGVRSHRWAGEPPDDAANNRKLLRALAEVPEARRGARYRCAVVLASPDRVEATGEGACEGRITETPHGAGGFGYDPYFHSTELRKTFAEATAEEKHRVSHRGKALRALRHALSARATTS
jgi:XTP/dITP diphosphohydrolase